MTLKQDFADDFSSSAFGHMSGDPAIIGKWGSITQLDDGTYDAWFHDVTDFTGSLSGRRLANIERECRSTDGFVRLTGEGYTQGKGRDFVLRMAVLAGVKRKRRMSSESRQRASERMKRLRAEQISGQEAAKSNRSD